MSRLTYEIELGTAAASTLGEGTVTVLRGELAMMDECDLIVRGPRGELAFVARVVALEPTGRAAGLELVGFDADMRTQIAALAAAAEEAADADAADFDVDVDFGLDVNDAAVTELELAVPPAPGLLELAPPVVQDVSAGSALDLPLDPSLEEAPSYELADDDNAAADDDAT